MTTNLYCSHCDDDVEFEVEFAGRIARGYDAAGHDFEDDITNW